MFWLSLKWTIITIIEFYGKFGWGETACDFQEKDDNFGDKNSVMNEISILSGSNVFLNMQHSYDSRDKNIVGKGYLRAKLKSKDSKSGKLMPVPDENVNPMDNFKDNFGQKRGSEVETNSAASFMSDMLDIKGKCDPRMYNFDAYRRTKSTLQEHNGAGTEVDSKNNLSELIDATPQLYEDSGIKNSKSKVFPELYPLILMTYLEN